MLGERPTVLSSRDETYARGKDTGRYWDSGAGNVHWVICTSEQVAAGVETALERVQSDGVFVEGTSVLNHVQADYSIMVVGKAVGEIKPSASRVLERIDALYSPGGDGDVRTELGERLLRRGKALPAVPLYLERDLDALAAEVGRIHAARRPLRPLG
ncbi:MAG TPA: hypothetical protein VJH03_26775 [Blastocatellia bacterium]|nr:hypothetical protein [Blastocatellia bacterium]